MKPTIVQADFAEVEVRAVAGEIRSRRMYHDRDLAGRNFLSCIVHGRQVGPVSQFEAETGHATGRRCPACERDVAASAKPAAT